MFEEVLEKVGFWILAGGGTACVIAAYLWTRGQEGMASMSLPMTIITILVVIIASAFFCRD